MASAFFTAIDVSRIGNKHGRGLWRLQEPLVFRAQLNGAGGVQVTVPRGFVTDFASIPRGLWNVFPPDGRWCEASVMHDYLYSVPGCSRFLADALFREGMAVLGVPLWRRVLMYYAVRLFGAARKK